jgi:allophanate hydrolase subunit 2
MDSLSFAIGNILVGNPRTTEGLEIVVVPGVGCSFKFFVPTVVAFTGMGAILKLNGHIVPMWSRIVVPQDGKLEIEAKDISISPTGFRIYLSISGGFPDVPIYLGSKSASMGLGGYQVCLEPFSNAIFC